VRALSTSFADLYRGSVESAPVQPGDVVQGHIVGQRRPKSSSNRFYVIDFGLKSEAPFTAKEIPGSSAIGDDVSMPLVEIEDDFNEPVFDFEKRSALPSLLAERYELLAKAASPEPRILHGRFVSFKKGGASVKVLGTDAFAPRYHVVAIDRPMLGSYAPFFLMSMTSGKRLNGDTLGLDISPVVSSYGGFLFCAANLVGIDSAWEKSGGGSPKERLAYLRLLTRLLHNKNSSVRRIMPRDERARNKSGQHRRFRRERSSESHARDAHWLNDLPQGEWASSKGKNVGDVPPDWVRFRDHSTVSRLQKSRATASRAGEGRVGMRGRRPQNERDPRNLDIFERRPVDDS